MKRWKNVAWWLCFTVLAVCVEAVAPGLDAMVVGLIILLQEDDYRDMLWLAPLFILLQEGMGTRPFGAIIVWYAAVAGIFIIGRWLFQTKNFLFMFLLSACLGAAYFGLAWVMDPLQNRPFNLEETLDNSLIQALFIPFAWILLTRLRPRAAEDEEKR